MDILIEKNWSSMDLTYWSVCLFSRRGGNGVKKVDLGYRYYSQKRALLIRVYENLVQHPSNDITI